MTQIFHISTFKRPKFNLKIENLKKISKYIYIIQKKKSQSPY